MKSPLMDFLNNILSVGGIAGLIALGIAGTICARYLQYGAEEIPQVLTYSLTTIIGFYFGTGVSKARGTSRTAVSSDVDEEHKPVGG
ncbi:MAG: hypothetical protein IIA72_13970 [Proteobacteria bacterium]|nr:hypothetical protein [Pseudomonadota bacterium]